MIKIKLTRTIKGNDLTNEFNEKYESMENLKEILNEGKGDMKLESDLEDWEYFLEHPEEKYTQEMIIYDEKPSFSQTDLEILNLVKNENPSSISELSAMMGKNIGNVAKNVNKLKEKGLIGLEEGKIHNMKTPVFNYDKIEIAI
ncbi:MAG: winged helix-turn-helix transcriptional regulator [Methanobrevibacter sp.]|jgi:chromosome segregation and condensation protein ScpB|nr:winged helix-turn-helix transcriptional regulator [Methanobrevibacter sp.]